MNKSLRQLFTIVVALFVILGMSTTIITAIRANQLNSDPRNTRALYHEYGAPRGAILASDGSVIAKSDPSNDAFSYQRSYAAGALYAPVTGFFSISQRGWSGIEASRSSLLSGQSDQLVWQRFKSLFTGQENKGATIETSIDPKIQQAAYNGLANNDGAAVAIEVKDWPYSRHGEHAKLRSEPAGKPRHVRSERQLFRALAKRIEPDAQPRHLAAVSSGIHVQDGGGGRRVGNGRISDRHRDSGRIELYASRYGHAVAERSVAGRRFGWQDHVGRRDGVFVEHRIRPAGRGFG